MAWRFLAVSSGIRCFGFVASVVPHLQICLDSTRVLPVYRLWCGIAVSAKICTISHLTPHLRKMPTVRVAPSLLLSLSAGVATFLLPSLVAINPLSSASHKLTGWRRIALGHVVVSFLSACTTCQHCLYQEVLL